MPTLYPENTQYGSAGSVKPPKVKYPSLTNKIPASKKVLPKGNFGAFAAPPTGLSEAGKALMSSREMNFPVNGPMIKPPDQAQNTPLADFLKKNTPLEPGGTYDFNKPGTFSSAKYWATPSDKAISTLVSSDQGGGEYIQDPSQPGKIIRTTRDFSSDENILIRNGLNPARYQIDHIVPLWAGGANTLENRQIIGTDEHARKTKIQAVPLTLMANGLITPEEALKATFSWQGKDDSNIADPDKYGMLPINVAQREYENWKKQAAGQPIDTGSSWKNFMNVIGSMPKNAYKGVGSYYRNVLLGGGDETVSASVTKEFGKGLISAIPFADVMIPDLAKVGNYSDPQMQTAANLMAFHGRLTGDLLAFGAVRAVATKALGALGVARFAKVTATMTRAEKEAALTSKVLKGRGILTSPTLGVTKVGIGRYAIPGITAKGVGMANVVESLKLGTTMAALGQTHLQEEEQDNLQGRIYRMMTDMVYGTVLGTQGHSIAGYSRVGGLTMGIGLMSGQNAADATLNSVTMMALHGLGHSSKNNILGLAMEDPQYAAAVRARGLRGPKDPGGPDGPQGPITETPVAKTKEGVVKKTLGNIGNNLYAPDVDAAMIKAAQNTILRKLQDKAIGEATQFRMAWLGKDYQPSTDEVVLQRQNTLIHEKINQAAAKNEWGPEAIRAAKFQTYVSAREMYKSTLPPEIRTKEDLADLMSVGKNVADNNGRDSLGVPKDVEKIANNLPDELFAKPDISITPQRTRTDLPDGTSPLGGSGLPKGHPDRDNLDFMVTLADGGRAPVTKIMDETGRDAYLMKAIIAYEPENLSSMININKGMDPVEIARGNMKPMQHPENYVGLFAYGKDANGDVFVKRIPPIARESHINKLNESWQRDDVPHRMDSKMNKDALSEAFKKNGLKYSLVDVVYIPETGVLSKQTGLPTSFAKAYINEDVFSKNAKIISEALKAPDAPKVDLPVMREALATRVATTPAQARPGLPEAPIAQKTTPPTTQAPTTPKPTLANTGITARQIPAQLSSAQESLAREATQKTIKAIDAEARGPVTIAEENPNSKIVLAKAFDPTEVERKSPAFNELVKNADQDDYIIPRTWTEFDAENLNKGAVKTIDNALKELDPNSEQASVLGNLKKEFSRESMTKAAKEIAQKHGPQGDDAAKAEFKKNIVDKFKAAGLEDPTTAKNVDRILNRMFIQAAYSRPRVSMTYKTGVGFKIAQRAPQEDSYLDGQIDAYVAKHPEAKDMDIIYFEKPDIIKTKDGGGSEEPAGMDLKSYEIGPKKIASEMYGAGYVPMGASGNDRSTMWGVKFIPGMANGGDINNPASRSVFVEKFLREVAGFGDNLDDTVVTKRSKLFNNHEAVNPIKGITITNYILPSETLGDLGLVGKDSRFSSNTSPEGKNNMLNKSAYDGKIFMTKEAIQEILEKGGYVGTRTRLKPTMAARTDRGLILQKGDISVLDDYHKKLFEGRLGRKIEKYDVVTFEDNIKSGLETAQPTGNGFRTLQTPSEAWRFAYSHPHEPTGTISLGSILSKFNNTDGVNKAIMDLYSPEIIKFRGFIDEIQLAKDSNELKNIFKRYEEYGKSDFADNLYGKVKKMVDNGADTRAIGKNIDTMLIRIFQDYVVAGKFINADHLILTPDFKSKLNRATGEREFLGPNEIMISEKTFKKMYGDEALGKIRSGEDFYAMTVRYPTTRKTAMSKAKIYIAEDNGIKNLGEEQMIPSLYDTYVRKEGDFDADGFTIFRVGDKGIPNEVANRIEQVRAQDGDIVLDPLTSYKKTKLTPENAEKAIMDITEKAIGGGDAVAITSSMNRVMSALVDSRIRIVLNPSAQGTRKADIYFGDTLYKTIDIKGKGVDTVEMTPHYDKNDDKMMSQIIQFSTDSAKASDLSDTLTSANIKKVEDYIAKNLFKNVNNSEEMSAVKNMMRDFQTPYVVSDSDRKLKSGIDLFRQMEEYNAITDTIVSSGGKLGPVQEIMSAFKGQKGFDFGFGDPKTQWRVDEAGVKAVEAKFRSEYIQTKDVKSFQDFVNQARIEYSKLGSGNRELKNQILDKINDRYAELDPSLTPEEKKSIAYWLTTSQNANMQNNPEFSGRNARERSSFVQRLDYIFNEVPDIAREYYAGRATYTPEAPGAAAVTSAAPVAVAKPITKSPVTKYTGLKQVVASSPSVAAKNTSEILKKGLNTP